MSSDEYKVFGVKDLHERYRSDSQFKAMADLMLSYMLQNKVQPYEVRDAAFIAELMYRERVVWPLIRVSEELYIEEIYKGNISVDRAKS